MYSTNRITMVVESHIYTTRLIEAMGINVDSFVSKVAQKTLCKEILIFEWGRSFYRSNISIKNAIYLLEEIILPNEIRLGYKDKTTDEILSIIRQHYQGLAKHSKAKNQVEKSRASPQGVWQRFIQYVGISKKND